MGGLFTSVAAVDTDVSSADIDDTDSPLSLPRTSNFFRLIKNHTKLPLSTYSTNRKLCLKNLTANAEVTSYDLSSAMDIVLDQ